RESDATKHLNCSPTAHGIGSAHILKFNKSIVGICIFCCEIGNHRRNLNSPPVAVPGFEPTTTSSPGVRPETISNSNRVLSPTRTSGLGLRPYESTTVTVANSAPSSPPVTAARGTMIASLTEPDTKDT